MALSNEQIEHAQPGLAANGRATDKPYKMADGGGLFMEVAPNGSKRWRLKYRFAGKENRISLGIYPDVSIETARERRDAYRALLANGIDPSEHIKAQRETQRLQARENTLATRFAIDNLGSLAIKLENRHVVLSPKETSELSAFLDATRAVTLQVNSCP